MNTPFALVPWDADFVAALHSRLLTATDNHPERAVVIFPHDRPRRYLYEQFRQEQRALLLPRVHTVREWFAGLAAPLHAAATSGHHTAAATLYSAVPRQAGLIDQVAMLYACCQDVLRAGETVDDQLRRLLHGGEATFFPWGERLAALLEDCLIQGLTPTDVQHAETEVAPFGAALLGALGRIFAAYVTMLGQRNRTTPGLDAYVATSPASPLFAAASPLLPTDEQQVFVAGFHTLTGTEERLFRHLWQHGAHICLHSDPALADDGRKAHWSCAAHAQWIAKWRAKVELIAPPSGHRPALHFFAGHDLHSQLTQCAVDMENDALEHVAAGHAQDPAPSRAVVLTHSALLLPALHHLPDKQCNISLGYPLERTLLFRLLELILQLAEQRTPEGLVPWRLLTELVSHPWLRLLRMQPLTPESLEQAAVPVEAGADDATSTTSARSVDAFARLLHQFEQQARQGGRLQDPSVTAQLALEHMRAQSLTDATDPAFADAPLAALLARLLHCTVEAWAAARTLADMAACLAGLAELLGSHGQEVWRRFPLDAECLVRLTERVIPPLRDNDMAHSALPTALRHAMTLALLHAERVPFEADPLLGLQVLGMLETRLLRFSRIYVLDATDDVLPGAPTHDPLLPDSLRGVIGLPDTHHRELLAAHTLHRLLAGADEAYLYWQEGVEASGLLDAKKQRSRLVEELIWQEEQARGHLLQLGDGPLRTSSPRLHPPRNGRQGLERTPGMQARLAEVLREPLTPSRLDAYLTCPLAFYYRYVARLNALDEMSDGDDPAAVGELLHAVLQDAYDPWLGRTLHRGDLSSARLEALFQQHVHAADLYRSLPPESAAMLAVAGPMRLGRYLRCQPDTTRIAYLEQSLTVPFAPAWLMPHITPYLGSNARLRLGGRLDRADVRPLPGTDATSGVVILDYKTGRLRPINAALWSDSTLWRLLQEGMDKGPHADAQDDLLLCEIAAQVPSVQLPCYLMLHRGARAAHTLPGMDASTDAIPDAHDAAWVELADDGSERPLFGEAFPPSARAKAMDEQIPCLLGSIVRHMVQASTFPAHDGKHCSWCLFQNLCSVA